MLMPKNIFDQKIVDIHLKILLFPEITEVSHDDTE